MRWLHIFLSLFGLAVILFFSVTGITLNHPDWFYSGAQRSAKAEGQVDLKWLGMVGASTSSAGETDPDQGVAKLEIVEQMRTTHGVHGALAEFRIEENECALSFKGPGYAADVFIDRLTGKYTITQTYHGFFAIINDLHKGRDTGKAWSLLIDVSAAVMTLVSLTGLILLFYLKRRRLSGVLIALVGMGVVFLIYWLCVP